MRYHLFKELDRNFIISESPTADNMEEYIKVLQQHSINLVINLTELNTYNNNDIINANIKYLHFPLQDGSTPSDPKINYLLKILDMYNSIAFHCTAGFGRAPLMLAISFIMLYNKNSIDIIKMIREKEKNALNNVQVRYLFSFSRKKYINNNCTIC